MGYMKNNKKSDIGPLTLRERIELEQSIKETIINIDTWLCETEEN